MPTLTPSRTLRARTGATVVLTALAVAGVSWVAAPTASAQGENGDIRIHREGVPYGVPKDDPVVCRFYLDAVNFDILASIAYTITPRPPLPAGATVTGAIQLAGGAGHTEVLGLADGQYTLTWVVTGIPPKEKVFRVRCNDDDRREGGRGDGDGGPRGQIEDNGRGGEGGDRGDRGDRGEEGWGRGDDDGPRGGVHAGGGGLGDTVAAYAPVAGAGLVGLVAVGGTVYVRRTRRQPHGAA
ncbi:hypothetical protein SAMN04487981_12438 [Streptomyces sp. cf386]|uniref:hypothetical protein n=1 Tax=Streptomyces sp. cf386 TaxID=1761904 RepID=UPI000881095E|nr:hypothetical protein [Streptomyces sp. cf386]SDP48769.1 hypothetical protein SAMN04487981_12438 [Streptomyces sp. cf386]